MGKAKINDLYEQAHVVHEIPYDSSVVDPSIVSVHKQRVFDRYLFAKLIVRECVASIPLDGHRGDFGRAVEFCQQQIKQHFGVES